MRRWGLAAAVFFAAPAAVAQQPGLASMNRYDPPERGSEWFVGDTLDLRGKVRPAFGTTLEGGYRVVAFQKSGQFSSSLLRDVVTLHAGGSLVVFDRVRVGLELPIIVFQDAGAQPITLAGVQYAPPSEQALGDLRLGADVRIFGTYGSRSPGRLDQGFSLAAGLQTFFPTGSQADWASDGRVRFAPRVLGSAELGPIVAAARFGFMFGRNEQWVLGAKWGQEVQFALSAGVRTLARRLVVGPELWWSAVILSEPSGTPPPNADSGSLHPVEWLFGAHYTAGPVRFGAGIGSGISHDLGTPQVRWLASLEYTPALAVDSDGDGVLDDVDQCPNVVGVRENGGCPPDRDRDGVADALDACPDVFGQADLRGCPPDMDGDGVPDAQDKCPKVYGVAQNGGCPPDSDKDGVWDEVDACPTVPGPKENRGCPPDADRDGVPDAEDACPDVRGVRSTNKAFDGCPADIDGDGIENEADACPREKGVPTADAKTNGCPPPPPPPVSGAVAFKAGSAELPAAHAELDAALATLAAHAEIKVVVEGHADAGEANGTELSAKRASAVAKWLVAKGVAKERVLATGLGSTKPLDKGATEPARAKNRRVELRPAP